MFEGILLKSVLSCNLCLKYLVIYNGSELENVCPQNKISQSVLYLHILRHIMTHSVDHILRLFDLLIRTMLTFVCEVWGVENCDLIDKVNQINYRF